MTPPGTVNATDQARLIDYLTNNNGNLYIESTKLGFDHLGTEMMTRFGIKFHQEGEIYEVQKIEGKNKELLKNIDYSYSGGNSPHYLVDRLVSTAAEVLYTSEDGYQRMFAYNPDNTYKVISSSIVLSALKNDDSLSIKPYIVAEIIRYFLEQGSATSLQKLFGKNDDSFLTIYPNPFNDLTSIHFTLNKQSNVSVQIFDNTGKIVKQLTNNKLNTGEHSFTWNGTDNEGNRQKSGFYYCTIQADDRMWTGKILLY
ncbi:MAG: T9SS type A sorting domain-containing protein [Sphingobacteriia bacterium]|nr:T9SS type A sorting domain-containing protein [Sphingobacteriia bacterium]